MRVYLLVMLIAARGHLPAPRRLAPRLALAHRARSRRSATATCTRCRPRGWAAWRCSSASPSRWSSPRRMPFLAARSSTTPARRWAILGGATLVCLLGVADDIWDLDWMTKLAGQVLAAGLMAWQGVQLVTLPIVRADDRLEPARRSWRRSSSSSSPSTR